jgi:VWFA-related protein
MRCFALLIPVALFAFAPQRPQEPPPPAAMVNLNVVALDSKGQSVTDLTAADFKISDNGKPQTIASFRRRDAAPAAARPLAPRQYSNRSASGARHATVILFDLMNMQFTDRGYVFNQLTHALQQFEAGDHLYLYLIKMNGGLYPVHPLPDEDAPAAPPDESWTRNIQAKLNEAMQLNFGQRPTDIYFDIDLRVRTTFSTLSMVAARLAGVPGRKNIVWLTHGIPISLSPARTATGDWVDYSPYIRQLSNTLDRADVSIYAVQQSPPGSAPPPGTEMDSGGRGQPTSPFAGMGSEETLEEFANLTGGRAYQNNDIAGAIKQAVNDARQSYLISYAPPAENWDGKYHKVRVTCARKGVRIQTRQGYLAFAEQAATGKQEQDEINAAITSPFDAAEIGLTATATPLKADSPALHLAVRVELAGVQLTRSGDAYNGQLSVRFVEYQKDGSMRQSKPAAISLRLSVPEHDAALKDGYAIAQDLAIASGAEKVRVIVFDRGSAAVGSLSIPVGPQQ